MNMARTRFLKDFPEALESGNAALFVGAGVSMGAGYPSWSNLLHEIGEELGVSSSDIHDLAALAQWSIQETGSATRVRSVIREKLGPLYPVPDSLAVIARLPVRHIWTTNYDRLIERAFEAIGRPLDLLSSPKDLSLKATPGATRLYKMHGSVDRLDDVVISTDDYELYRSKRGAYLPLLQAQLTSMSMLFVGLSLTDPNIRHVLSLIRESFTEAPPEHFAIVRPPHKDDFRSDTEYKARAAQHSLWAKDLRRYGLIAVDIDEYSEVQGLLHQIERRVARKRVWVSGSWPIEPSRGMAKAYKVAEEIGRAIGESGKSLVSGGGLVVGSAALAGFLDSLRGGGGWDIDRRLIVRPFPQALLEHANHDRQWADLRQELARISGVVVFVGGAKEINPSIVIADGVIEEARIAQASGAFLLPIGASGGAAQKITEDLFGSTLPAHGNNAARPTDDELRALSNPDADVDSLVSVAMAILKRIDKAAQ
ncbi:SIR2 family protein [Nevskia soli]|uniref:SIR2 family protein n=1 Tax=Nevskia soli TaxID=418856 RepID=UPI0009FC3930|nr:SIR2 family protein [Nevskia soli]